MFAAFEGCPFFGCVIFFDFVLLYIYTRLVQDVCNIDKCVMWLDVIRNLKE